MTIRLYYDDSYLKEFAAVVLEVRDRGGKPAVVLDRTAFYPTSGGQPHDTGFLGAARVLDVEESPSGEIVHILDSPLQPGPVSGRVDWERRFDHMQQHTGQHILSQAFIQVAQASTVSFHLGVETSTIDLDLHDPSPSVMDRAEHLATSIVFENRPIRILKVDRAQLSELGVRKESHREGEIRVIEVNEFDRSPCGGTHMRRTGEVGLICLPGYERYKGGTRVEFVCGGRVLKVFRTEHDILKELAKLCSSHFKELPRLTDKLLQDRTALARENTRLLERMLEMEAQELLDRADMLSGIKIVRRSYADRGLDTLKVLAQKTTALAKAVAIFGVAQEPAQVAVAKSPNTPGDCGQAVKAVAAKSGGRGGGRPDTAQAGGIALADLEDWMQALEAYFRSCVGG